MDAGDSKREFSAESLFELLCSSGLLLPAQADTGQADSDAAVRATDSSAGLSRWVRVLHSPGRPVNSADFRRIGDALLRRQRLRILYHGRGRDSTNERVISPQRLVYYRGGWYLDAWCHLREALRHFALDRMHVVEEANEPAREVDGGELDWHFASAYGIFSGEATAIAVLKFTPSAARWVADEHWHPDQQGKMLRDGSYELRIPFREPRELIMDILRHGPDVEVLAPEELRHRVAQLAARTAAQYRPRRGGGR